MSMQASGLFNMKAARGAMVALMLAACGGAVPGSASMAATSVKVETVAEGLEQPWGLAFLPDGRMIVTEKPGRIRIVSKDGKLSQPVASVPEVDDRRQGGLLGIALDPKFAENRLIYFAFSEPRGDAGNGTSVARAKLVEEGGAPRLEGLQVIFRQMPTIKSSAHFGGRVVFAPDGTLFVTLGERYSQKEKAQTLDNLLGKLVRINPDGSVPKDNPFVGKPGARPEIWSYGHRNIQGAAINPTTGKIWTVEHGAKGGDEINIPEPGKNYGWPVITWGVDYSGAKIGEGTHKEGMEQPIHYWNPSIATSGLAFYTGTLFPEWKGDVFVGGLAGQMLAHVDVEGNKVVGWEPLLQDLGERIRDVVQGPDGALYLLTDNVEGRVLRVVPATAQK
ncbi:PQQ-dependent sugar dehydrogenase [Pedomonas mirosovicensis]|uniref:PQQ-dependent sugar dehydrogenase n=1 Tax=Pedomonas mirosovicensis TaxID=2908641 RepID=UPI00216A836C|nr:PQQ-dependent sugar dehydrogenase [Pedomonas mirosovicensis]MCH8683916.1 PQQ-dependent sugar dehydrogenase [Pedomonas mirosovicensis]